MDIDALKFDKELAIIERKAMIAARKMGVKLRQDVLSAVQRGKQPDVVERVMRETVPLLRDAMLVADLRGRLASKQLTMKALRSGVHTPFLRLSVFDEVIKTLEKQTSAKVAALRAKYSTDAFTLVRDLANGVEDKVRSAFHEEIGKGSHVGDAVKTLSKRLNDLGVAPQSNFRLETLFRTQTQIAYGAGRWQADQDPVVQEILWGYEYVTVGDDRVREEHAVLEGTRLPKDDPFWQKFWPPNGWNCRCQAIPIFEPEPIKSPPRDAEPDEGFAFNAGVALAA